MFCTNSALTCAKKNQTKSKMMMFLLVDESVQMTARSKATMEPTTSTSKTG